MVYVKMENMRSVIVVCFVVLFCADFIQISNALKLGDDGACEVKISTRKTRTKMVTINKWCGKKKCGVKKVETYTVPERKVVCCNGFMYDVDTETCSPICSTGCNGGRCTAPDVCACDAPALLHKNTCVLPTCDPPCVNAQCFENNTCQCNLNYTSYNSTHCYKCEPGYSITEDFSCAPLCTHKCVNGNCTAPDTCSCFDGYKLINNTCEPNCDLCVNSTCTAPNKCTCLEGYKQYNNTVCVPQCDNCTGECIAPNICTCSSGFKNISGVCSPVCERCENGVCTLPNVCTCNEGYSRNESNPMGCVKNEGLRNCDQPTEVNVTTPKTSYMRSKGKKCPSGTKECKAHERKNLSHFKPREEKCCVKKFIAHEKRLLCCEGYEYESDRCISLCRLGCVNGRCVKSLVHNNHTCECSPGYTTYNVSHCAIECPPGFINDIVSLECLPLCEIPCRNGICTGPNTCTCSPGYVLYENTTCVPECMPSCVNAECVAPNTCSCLHGYTRKSENETLCSPVCDQPCGNGNCTAPNICQCDTGYEKDPENEFNCIPTCEPKCVNASCVSPNTCSCHPGYETTGSSFICQPKCDDCQYGECTEPNVCTCHEGYSKKEGKCTPDCDQPCSNGFCSEPNVCTCNEDYELTDIDKFKCQPICNYTCVNATCVSPNKCSCWDGYEEVIENQVCQPKCNSCVNGDCIAPNICQCKEGYNMTDGNCLPVCSIPCVNGDCTSPNNCTCFEGYEKSSPNGFICTKPCETACDHGICSLNGICRCDLGYQMLNYTCSLIPPVDCLTCEYNCTEHDCSCSSGVRCFLEPEVAPEVSSSTTLAGLELTWTLAGAVGLLLLVLVVSVMHRLYRKRKACETKDVDQDNPYGAGSVVYNYTVPDSLVRHDIDIPHEEDESTKLTTETQPAPQLVIQDEKL